MTVELLIQHISLSDAKEEKMALFRELWDELYGVPKNKTLKKVAVLLYDTDVDVRKEAASVIDFYGYKLPPSDRPYFLFAAQDFVPLWREYAEDPQIRSLVFEALKNESPRFREKILRAVHFEDCDTPEEKRIYRFASEDYEALVEEANSGDKESRDHIIELLSSGVENNCLGKYHNRRCAETLWLLGEMEKISQETAEILKKTNRKREGAVSLGSIPIPDEETKDSLTKLLLEMNRKGISINGKTVFPEISVGTVTGRITYKNPGLQSWPVEQRIRNIDVPPGKIRLCFDYVSIEPTLLLNYLILNGFFNLEEIPTGDFYEAIVKNDRKSAKKWLNGIINGAGWQPPPGAEDFAFKLQEAIVLFREEAILRYRLGDTLMTIAGRKPEVNEKEHNFGGKLVNRLIQGSAADLFNAAIINLREKLNKRKRECYIQFLLFDEVWLIAARDEETEIERITLETMNSVYSDYDLPLPVYARRKNSDIRDI